MLTPRRLLWFKCCAFQPRTNNSWLVPVWGAMFWDVSPSASLATPLAIIKLLQQEEAILFHIAQLLTHNHTLLGCQTIMVGFLFLWLQNVPMRSLSSNLFVFKKKKKFLVCVFPSMHHWLNLEKRLDLCCFPSYWQENVRFIGIFLIIR